MRPSTTALNDRFATRTGTEPLLVLAVNWGLGATWFTSRASTLPNSEPSYAKILEVGSCSCDKRDDNTGTTGAISITLDDADNLLKNTAVDFDVVEQAGAALYLFYEDIGDMMILLNGRVRGPVEWLEGNRVLRLNIEAFLEEGEAGFVPTDEFDDLSDEAKGRAWPMIFGKCAHVPTVKVREHKAGITKTNIRMLCDLYEYGEDSKIKIKSACTTVDDLGAENVIDIKDGSKFPQGEEIKISIDGVIFKGEFAEDIFTVAEANCPRYENIDFADRVAGPDNQNAKVGWIEDKTVNIQGCHVYLESGSENRKWHNYCVLQEGTKCIFKYAMISPVNGRQILVTTSHTIEKVLKIGEFGASEEIAHTIYETANFYNRIISVHNAKKAGSLRRILDQARASGDFFWTAPAGTKVRLWGIEDPDIYIVSVVECTAVHAVYARKKLPIPDMRDEKIFAVVPKSLYTLQLQSDYEINGNFATGLIFDIPLDDLKDDGWEDEVYVTATSSVGPNAADIIEWLITEYTSLGINGSSFSDVADRVANTPCNFAVFEKKNALDFAREIAWQSRIGIRLDSVSVDLVYLPHEPTYLMEFTETNTNNKSLNFQFTPVDQIITKLSARWRESYKGRNKTLVVESPEVKGGRFFANIIDDKDSDERIYVYRNNINKFGERNREVDIYIYNEQAFVQQTIDFWGYRLSNCWRYIVLETFLPAIVFQPWDGVALDYSMAAINSIGNAPAIVEETQYDHNTGLVTLRLWIPSQTGSLEIDENVWED